MGWHDCLASGHLNSCSRRRERIPSQAIKYEAGDSVVAPSLPLSLVSFPYVVTDRYTLVHQGRAAETSAPLCHSHQYDSLVSIGAFIG